MGDEWSDAFLKRHWLFGPGYMTAVCEWDELSLREQHCQLQCMAQWARIRFSIENPGGNAHRTETIAHLRGFHEPSCMVP
jgi:hypothetical protein